MDIRKVKDAVIRNDAILSELKSTDSLQAIVGRLEEDGIKPPRGGHWTNAQLSHYITRASLRRYTAAEEEELSRLAQALRTA